MRTSRSYSTLTLSFLTRSSGSCGLPRLPGQDRAELRAHLRNILLVLLFHHHRLHRRFRRFRRHPFRRQSSSEIVTDASPSGERLSGACSTILTAVGSGKCVHARGRAQADDWFGHVTLLYVMSARVSNSAHYSRSQRYTAEGDAGAGGGGAFLRSCPLLRPFGG